jgi:hypothetical protein
MTPPIRQDGRTIERLAVEIEAHHQSAYRLAAGAVDHALRCGDLLIEAKGRVKHGEWLPWLRSVTTISIRQAQNYMRLAKNRTEIEAAKTQRLSYLPIRDAIALLTEPGGEELVAEVGTKTAKAALAAYEEASDHPNAPPKLRQKAARQKAKAAKLSRMAPATVEGWRAGYINVCKVGCPDIDTELGLVIDAFHEIAGNRMQAQAAKAAR